MNDFMSMLQSLRQNPMQFLLQRKMNIPQGMNDPNAILNYLMQSGQVSQETVNNAYKMAQRFR
jgi:hypothetical protein